MGWLISADWLLERAAYRGLCDQIDPDSALGPYEGFADLPTQGAGPTRLCDQLATGVTAIGNAWHARCAKHLAQFQSDDPESRAREVVRQAAQLRGETRDPFRPSA